MRAIIDSSFYAETEGEEKGNSLNAVQRRGPKRCIAFGCTASIAAPKKISASGAAKTKKPEVVKAKKREKT
ncbi:MAG: hypothetical protein V1494_04190 [Candidatus Diapherotrites archaeon]